jgi:HSP20 family protein
MLLRFDPFRELDRVAETAWGRAATPMPMDAVRRGDTVVVSFDLPGVDPGSIDLTVERNVLSVKATRTPDRSEGDEVLASERRFGSITRQLMLGDTLDGSGIAADYDAGVLTVRIPVAQAAKPRKVEIGTGANGHHAEAIEAEATSAA